MAKLVERTKKNLSIELSKDVTLLMW